MIQQKDSGQEHSPFHSCTSDIQLLAGGRPSPQLQISFGSRAGTPRVSQNV